jgi:hypothetical protein
LSISSIRSGIGDNLTAVSGLRVAETIPDQPNPPVAVLSLSNVVYDGAFQGGLVTYNFVLSVIVGRVSERTAQNRLDTYISTGVGSIKKAIESDKSLGGAAYDVKVTDMTSVGSVTIGDATFLACDFLVAVYSN